ncbi:Serine/threonine-protein phosphatase 7 long form [Glycine max]|nr:Serine/threonine-protein phosphatase 7 long form [Glycine max]
MKISYLKINSSLITALIERWRPETHTCHMICGECTITLQDVSVLSGLRVDGAPLIGQTNLDWAELCEELLGVRPQEGELQEHLQRFTRAWILRFIGGVLVVDKSSSKCNTYAWGPAVLAYLYREMCSTTDYKIKSIGGMCILIQGHGNAARLWLQRGLLLWLRHGNQHIDNDDLIFLWEPYTTTVMSMLPPICLVGSVAWCAVVPLICFHVVECHQPDRVLRQFGMQ